MRYYKVARTDGFDLYTGNTINYRENIGKIVKNPNKNKDEINLCSDNVLHASELFIDALSYGELPCSIFIIEGTPVSIQSDKCGFKQMKIVEEISTNHWQEALQDWLAWTLTETTQYIGKEYQQQLDAVNQVIKLLKEAKTRKVSKDEWDAAYAAANAADAAAADAAAADAARAAAYAARAAADAAAADAADAAADAARAAAAYAAADAAYAAYAARAAAAYAARAAADAADAAAYAARAAAADAAAKRKYSEKFIEILRSYQ